MKKFNFNNNIELSNCFLTKIRIGRNKGYDSETQRYVTGKAEYKKAIKMPNRNECILLEDVLPIIKVIKSGLSLYLSDIFYIRTYYHRGGGYYEIRCNRTIKEYDNVIMVGCQEVSKITINSLKLK